MIVHHRAIRAIEPCANRKVTLTLLCTPAEKPVVSHLKVTPFLDWIERQ
ncbi:hypothetical protein [Spirosoma panaciterrae]|nr:hypothetical protein [Spirosoma panaciterrae]